MPSDKNKNFAVLTGDIVESTKLENSKLQSVRAFVFESAIRVGDWKQGLVRGKPDFFRGDSWQMLMTDPARSLRAAFFIRAFLRSKSADTSIAMGIGPVEKISNQRISLSTGLAFVRSGHALDGMRSGHGMAISFGAEDSELAQMLDVILRLCEALFDQLSDRQAELVALALHPSKPTHEEISRQVKPKVDRKVVSKTLTRAGFRAIEAAVNRFESENWALEING